MAAINIMRQSVVVSLAICRHTTMITATAPIFTASKKLRKGLDFCILGINGFKNATNKKEGKKMPNVAITAPENPFNW